MLRPLDWPPIKVETTVPADVLDSMIARTEAGFRKLGETDPHWSVLTADRFRAANIAANKAEFFRTGEEVTATVWRVLARAAFNPTPKPPGSSLAAASGA